MAKRELKCGYRPLRPWERLFAYVSFIILMALTWDQAKTEGVSVRLTVYTATLLIALVCAFIAFWDTRITARLRRREQTEHMERRRQMVMSPKAEAGFTNASGEWEYFHDPLPTT